jgi:hypothetical protein
MSYAPVIFRDLNTLTLSMASTRAESRGMLSKACKISGEEYRKIREQRSMLPEMVSLAEDMAKLILLEKRK